MLEADPAARPRADDFLTIIRRQQAGKLKLYLGPCPGVGKTYSMLVEGNRLKQRGVDVVIGYVEPHDRPRERPRRSAPLRSFRRDFQTTMESR